MELKLLEDLLPDNMGVHNAYLRNGARLKSTLNIEIKTVTGKWVKIAKVYLHEPNTTEIKNIVATHNMVDDYTKLVNTWKLLGGLSGENPTKPW